MNTSDPRPEEHDPGGHGNPPEQEPEHHDDEGGEQEKEALRV
jgi:hypothetical protein